MKLGPMELAVILIVVLLIFGPKNLPKLGKAVGSTVKNIREGLSGDDEKEEQDKSVEAEKNDDEVAKLERQLAEAKAKKAAESDEDAN